MANHASAQKSRLTELAIASGFIALVIGAVLWALPLRAAEKTTLLTLKQKLVEQAVSTLLNNQLPLKLDANAVHPTIDVPPGGPFQPLPLKLTREGMNRPLPPGDYVVKAVAFCSEYSVHRPGAGVAYEIAPMQGKASQAIATLLWRGVVEKKRNPHDLQAVSWAIQAGVTYAKMPKIYQAIVDDVIPDYRGQLGGDFFQDLEDLYQGRAKDAGLPPLETLLTKLGKPGELAISANRQRKALLRQNTNDQIRDQVLFAGQESRTALVKASEGPWTVMIPDVAYLRYRVVGGNMRADNEIWIRILPPKRSLAIDFTPPRAIFASYRSAEPARLFNVQAAAAPSGPSVSGLTSGGIGYSVSRGAQALAFVPTPTDGSDPSKPDDDTKAGTVSDTKGTATVTHNGETKPLKPGDEIHMGDTLETAKGSMLRIEFPDGTSFVLSEQTKLKVDEYVYDPSAPNGTAHYSVLAGAFQYVSGLIAKKKDPDIEINAPVGCICIRGTEFIAQYDPKTGFVDVALIDGAVMVKPIRSREEPHVSAPAKIRFNINAVTTSSLTREEYESLRTSLTALTPRYIY